MKKVLFIAATATLFAFSCQKEMESVQTETIDGFSFSANAPALNNPGTKASINDSHGLVWAAGDKIGVYVNGWSTNSNQSFTLIGEGGTTSGSFRRTSEDWFNTDQAQIAFFPWTSDKATTVNTETDNNVSGSSVYFKLPGSYSAYSSSKMLTPLVAPVVYSGTEWVYEPIEFKHAGGAVKVKVSDLPAGAHSIGMTTASQQIHGNYHISVADAGNSNMALDGDADASKKAIWLNFEPTNSSRPFTFLFPVPALNENEKLSFQIYDKNDVLVWSRSVSTHPAINHGDVLLLGNDDAISIEPYRQLKEVSSEWGVCGSYNDWASDTEMMTDGTSCIATGLTLSKDATFKIRKDGAWTVQYGAYQLQNKGTYADDAYDDNKIKILADGTYDIVFQTGSTKVFVVPTGDCPYPSKAHHYTSIKNATELGSTETANCYVITEAGSYKIPVVKGNSSESAGTVGGVELLWETYNNGTSVTPNSVIEAVDWDERDNSHIYFKTPDSLQPGNALIAAKNADGDIIWSWHIWIPATAMTDIEDYKVGSKYYMDRNLGAIVATTIPASGTVDVRSVGLYYQWGRKDPFVGYKWGNPRVDVKVSGASGENRIISTSQISIQESIEAPTTLIAYKGDWLSTANNVDRWDDDGNKTIYDPCPAGYRVPDYDTGKPLWQTVTGSTAFSASAEGCWWKLGDAIFSLSGFYDYDGNMDRIDVSSYLWTAKSKTGSSIVYGEDQYVNNNSGTWECYPTWGKRKSCALPIRCEKIAGEVLPPIPAGVNGVTLDTNGDISDDWDDADAIIESSGGIKEWKYGYDSSNLYFYFKIKRSSIISAVDPPYAFEPRRYINFAFDTDNDSSKGADPNSGGLSIKGCEAMAYVHPFRGNASSSQGTDNVSIVNGVDLNSWTKILYPSVSESYDNIYAYGYPDENYCHVELSVPRSGLGLSSSFKGIMRVQFSLSWDLTSIARIEIK